MKPIAEKTKPSRRLKASSIDRLIGWSLGAMIVCFHASLMADLNFQITSPGPGAGTAVTVCAFDPTNPLIAYAGGDCQGIMRTLDGGKTWTAPNHGLIRSVDSFYESYFTLEIEIDPLAPANLYAGTQRGLYYSSDQATNWKHIDLSAIIDPETWGSHTPVGAIEIDPGDSKIVYLGVGDLYLHDQEAVKGILAKSSNGGISWVRIGEGIIPEDAIVYDIELNPFGTPSNRQILVSTDIGVFRSNDAGESFHPFETGLPHNKARRLTVSQAPNKEAVFYLTLFPTDAKEGGVFRWQTAQDGWTDANGQGGESPLTLSDGSPCIFNWIVAHPTNPNLLYLTSAPSYVEADQCDTETYFISTDGGGSWEEQWPSPESAWTLEPSIFAMIAIAPSDPSVLMAGYVSMVLSTDSGYEWKQIYADTMTTETGTRYSRTRSPDIGSQMWVLSLAADPRPEYSDTIFQGHADSLLFRSDDQEWFRRLAPFPVADPLPDLAAGWGEDGDGNLTPQITLDPDNPNIVYASANFRLFRSSNRGDTWTELTGWDNPYTDLTDEILNRDNATRFAIDPTSPPDQRRLFATVYPKGFFRSNDGGQNWTDLSSGLGNGTTNVSGVYLDPSDPKRIFLGTFSQIHYSQQDMWSRYPIYFSPDGGDSWEERASLPLVNRLWIDPDNGDRILAATLDMNGDENIGGIHTSTDGGNTWTRTLAQPIVTDIASDPHVEDRLWALSSSYYQPDVGIDLTDFDAGLYLSDDRGETWTRTGLELNHYMLYPLLIHPSRANELFIGTAGTGVKWVKFSESTKTLPRLELLRENGGLWLTITNTQDSQDYILEQSTDLEFWTIASSLTRQQNASWRYNIDQADSQTTFYRLKK